MLRKNTLSIYQSLPQNKPGYNSKYLEVVIIFLTVFRIQWFFSQEGVLEIDPFFG